jgi:hypothetical protein
VEHQTHDRRLLLPCHRADVIVSEGPQARLGVDLRGRKIHVSQELLHLVDGYEPGIKQDRRDGMTKQVRINAFLYARRTGAVGYD